MYFLIRLERPCLIINKFYIVRTTHFCCCDTSKNIFLTDFIDSSYIGSHKVSHVLFAIKIDDISLDSIQILCNIFYESMYIFWWNYHVIIFPKLFGKFGKTHLAFWRCCKNEVSFWISIFDGIKGLCWQI